MKYLRGDYRHVCFRLKNDQPVSEAKLHLIDEIQNALDSVNEMEVFPQKLNFYNFADQWDLYLDHDKSVVISSAYIEPIKLGSTTKKISLLKQNGTFKESDLTRDELQIFQMVEANRIEEIMAWEDFGKTWLVKFDNSTNNVTTFCKETKINKVEIPTPAPVIDDDPEELSEVETRILEKFLKSAKKKAEKK